MSEAQLSVEQRKALALANARIRLEQQAGSYDNSYFAQGTSGINEGIANLFGAPVDLTNAAIGLGMRGVNAVAGTDFQPSANPVGGSQFFRSMMGDAIRPESSDPSRQFTRRVGQEIGASMLPAGIIASRAAAPVASFLGQMGVATGSGVGGAVAQQVAPGNAWAEMGGQLAGGLAAGGIGALARKVITPSPASTSRLQAADTLADEGVNLTAGQRTGSKNMRYMEAELGGTAAQDFTEQQAEQFTRAALRRIGVTDASRATPEVMEAAYRRIGSMFDDLAARNSLLPDGQFGDDLSRALRGYEEVVGESARAPIVRNTVEDIVGQIERNIASGGDGMLTGQQYQQWASSLGKAARTAASSGNGELANALFSIRNALDDVMARTMQAFNPDDLGEWAAARSQYRNFIPIEAALSGAGEQAVSGIITPANLRNAVKVAGGTRNYVLGRGDLNELARVGAETMTALPDSGTASRLTARNLATGGAATLGAIAGSPGGIPGAAAGAIAGWAIPPLVGRAMLSGPGRAYLGNQLLPQIPFKQAIAGPAIGGAVQHTARPPIPLPMLPQAL